MGKLRKKVIRILKVSFTNIVDALDEVADTGRITGVIISDKFDGKSHKERQKMLWKALDTELTKDEQADIGPIATLTPAEAALPTT